jgi:hypothetical protein
MVTLLVQAERQVRQMLGCGDMVGMKALIKKQYSQLPV